VRLSRSLLPWGVLSALVAAYAGYFSFLSIRERDALYQFDEDLAIYDQIVWNTAHGRLFVSTLIQHANTMLGDHFSPAVALFVPFYWVWPSANVLLVGQSVLLALAAIPLYLFARKQLGAIPALLVAGAYLVYPALHYVNLFQFHEITMLPLPLAVALLAIEQGRRRLFFGAALVSLAVKEEVAIVVVGVGFLWWLRRRDVRMTAWTVALGVVAGIVTMGIILPHFNLAGSGYYYVRRYAYLGNSPLQIAFTALTSPGLVLAHLTTPDRLLFLAQLFVPLALTPLLGWEYVVAALPAFGYLLLGDSPDQYAIDRHYLTPLLPFLFFGAVVGSRRVGVTGLTPGPSLPSNPLLQGEPSSEMERGDGGGTLSNPGAFRRAAVLLACALFVACAGASYLIGPTPFGRRFDARAFTITEHSHQIGRLMAEIPPGASVSASRNLLSWFSERSRVYRFPQISNVDYILLDWRDLRYPAVYSLDDDALGRLFNSPDYRLVDSAGATTLFRRGNPDTWSEVAKPPTRFGGEFELLDDRVQILSTVPAVEVTLYWRALRKPSKQYTVFVHLVGNDGKMIGQGDSWPLDNLYPTDMWQPGRIVPDTHTIDLHQPVPADGFQVEVGLYDLKNGARLPITARGLPGGADSVLIDVKPKT
jgi:uncharacterized membrane protein